MNSKESVWPKIELDAFNIEELPTKNALMLSPEDNEYCKNVARYFKSRTKRVDKLFYFQWIEGFNKHSYGLTKELSQTPTERFLKQYLDEKKTYLGAFFNSLPQIDQSLFSVFSLVQQNTFSFFNKGDKSSDGFSLIKLDFSRLQNNTHGDSFFQGSPNNFDFQVFPRSMSAEEEPAHTFALGFHNFLKSTCAIKEPLSGLNLVDKEEKRLEKFFFEHFPSPFDTFFLTQDKKTIVYRVLKYLKMNRSFKKFQSDHLLVQTLFSQHFLEVSRDTNLLKTLAMYFIEDYQYYFSMKDFEKATIHLFYLIRISKLAQQGFELGMNPSDELKRLSKELESSHVIEVLHCAICLLQNEPLDINLLGLMCRSVFLIKNSDYFLKDHDEFKLSFHLMQLITRMIKLKFFDEKEKIANLLSQLSEQEVTEFINTRVLGLIVKLPSWKKIDGNPFAFKSENDLNCFSIFDSLFFPKDSRSLQPLAFFGNLCKKGKIHLSDFSLFGTGFIDEKRLFQHHIKDSGIYLEIDGRRLTLEPTLGEEVKKQVDLIEKEENLPFRFAFFRTGFWALFFGEKERRFDLTFNAQESKIKDSESSLLVQYTIANQSEKRLKDSILPSYSHRIQFSCEAVNDQQGAAAAATVNITAKIEGNLVLNLNRASKKLCLDADPLFVLAAPPRFLFGQFNNFIILLNERTGAQKVVFLGKKLTYIDRDDDGSFHPKSTLEKIALAKAFFLGKEYRSAFDWIYRSVPIGKMNKREFDQFYRIIDTKDQHPDALVCKLKIFSILNQEMVLNTPLNDSLDGYFKENFSGALSDTYEDFLSKEANITLKLPEEDERTLHIGRGFLSKILDLRKRFLTQGSPFPISKTKLASSEPFFKLELHPWYHQLQPKNYDLNLADPITPEKFINMILDIKKGENREFLYLLALFKKKANDHNEKVFAHILQGFLDDGDLDPFESPYDFKLFEKVIKKLKGRSYIADCDEKPYVRAKESLISRARKERIRA